MTSDGTRRVTLDRYPSQEKRRFSRVAVPVLDGGEPAAHRGRRPLPQLLRLRPRGRAHPQDCGAVRCAGRKCVGDALPLAAAEVHALPLALHGRLRPWLHEALLRGDGAPRRPRRRRLRESSPARAAGGPHPAGPRPLPPEPRQHPGAPPAGGLGAQYGTQHGNTVLGECIGSVAGAAPL